MRCTKMKVPGKGGRAIAATLHGLAVSPDVPVHPLRLLLLRKGTSLAEAANLFGWSLRKLMLVVREWHRPRDAERVAKELGRNVNELFPPKK